MKLFGYNNGEEIIATLVGEESYEGTQNQQILSLI